MFSAYFTKLNDDDDDDDGFKMLTLSAIRAAIAEANAVLVRG